ncbi:MAG: amidohydrolase family protein [Bryobacteraceae bacterium]
MPGIKLGGFCLLAVLAPVLTAQQRVTAALKPFIDFSDPVIALEHVRVIDGTGAAVRAGETIVIDHGKIAAAGPDGAVRVPSGARVLDLTGDTVYPGLIGMHEHLFYPSFYPPTRLALYAEQAFSAPRLYLACGITTMRTTGSMEPYTDLNLKREIQKGNVPGPDMDITGPYLEGPGGFSIQMPVIRTPEQARRTVDYWASEGVTSFKAYMHISHDALAAAIQEVHRHGLKITGHLCSVGFTEAADLGIDNLEHGLIIDSEFTPGKKPNACPPWNKRVASIEKLDIKGPQVQHLIQTLVKDKVAVTSTLDVFEAMISGRPPLEQRVLEAMSPQAAESYLATKAREQPKLSETMSRLLKKEMEFERAFVAGGGLLMAGADPTGNGGALPGFGDERNLELLVQAGFTPEQAIRIYSWNAAVYLNRSSRIGSIAPGKQADLVVVTGDPSTHIQDVEHVKYVFKDGIAYDSAKLIASVRGAVGIH